MTIIFIIITIIIFSLIFVYFNKKKTNKDNKVNLHSKNKLKNKTDVHSKNKLKNIDVYLISLDKDIERRNNLNIITDFTYSVNGKNLDLDNLKNKGILGKNCKLTKGEIGCYMSHVFMLQKSLKSIFNHILILEDDALIEDTLSKKIDNIITNVPKDFELLFLSYNYYEGYNYDFEKYEYYDQFEYYDYSDYKKINYVHGCQAYLVNKNLISEEKIKKLYPMEKPYDTIICKFFKAYIVIPKLIKLSKFGSYSNTQNI